MAPTTPAAPPTGATATTPPAPLRLIGRPGASGQQGVWRKAWLQGLNSSVLAPAPYGDASSPPRGRPRAPPPYRRPHRPRPRSPRRAA
ncbi:hypothetical protein ID875_00520 [Streptomyces globisporus]|uniref:Uncharacterized protein n=1 Tax=Streptomyces globisporus TaxID=1908 RepID=A0A927BID1_STRGL|nr:hypothetical protein [Streptomyces globisporus]